MTARQQATVDNRVAALCEDALAPITPGITAKKRKTLINRYNDGVGDLAGDGLLTQAQTAQLSGFATAL